MSTTTTAQSATVTAEMTRSDLNFQHLVLGDDRKRPLPEVKSLDKATTTVEEVVQALAISGCVIQNVASPETLALIEKDTRPHFASDKPYEECDFFPAWSGRVTGMVGKSKIFMDTVPLDPLYRARL